jgi:hypothetical protein
MLMKIYIIIVVSWFLFIGGYNIKLHSRVKKIISSKAYNIFYFMVTLYLFICLIDMFYYNSKIISREIFFLSLITLFAIQHTWLFVLTRNAVNSDKCI